MRGVYIAIAAVLVAAIIIASGLHAATIAHAFTATLSQIAALNLEGWYYVSQIALTGIAMVAAIGAGLQLRTFKRYELLKLLEDSRTREARRTLYHRSKEGIGWREDADLEKAASLACATFDIVGLLAKGANRRFFKRYWAYSICWTHHVLDGYLIHMRNTNPDSYIHYEKLHRGALKKLDPRAKSEINKMVRIPPGTEPSPHSTTIPGQ